MTVSFNQAFKPLNDALEPLIKMGFATPFNLTPGLVVLEVPGRKSGRQFSVSLVAYLAFPFVVVGTVRTESQWVKNLHAAEAPHVWVWGRRFCFDKVLSRDQLVVGQLRQSVS